ncbi:MAG TPA: putative selenate reductase subunit YgfK [Clostridiales bacterium]|nr:putative selenate reductase subunit YgfK [Clostridiales bacterium]
MSDKMTPVSFPQLIEWILNERKKYGTVFGVNRPGRVNLDQDWQLFGRKLEMPFGPAAGPHTQLCQNLVAAYYAGSRFFELKTVQELDGDDLHVSKPCIKAEDEGYNVEWSTELFVPQAFDEYVKAWIALHVIAREFELGDMDGFQFNMSVGYDLAGIRTEKIDQFIEGLKDARQTPVFQDCISWLHANIGLFGRLTAEDIDRIPATVCNSVTLSTLHGCPPEEIEKIARYLLEVKNLHTFVKCNPTLLGYTTARKILDEFGYDDLSFSERHFNHDLQYHDALPMLSRLKETAKNHLLEFGVKITNTFPVDIQANELPGQEMYMSGKALFPLSMSVAAKLAADFDGDLRISYSGGADFFNIDKIVAAGIWPVTLATALLKPGGYQRLEQIADKFSDILPEPFRGVNADAAAILVKQAISDQHYRKPVKLQPSRKISQHVPLTECYLAPCQAGCPIGQDITTYLRLVAAGKMEEALQVIIEKNPLPFITGTICSHFCMSKCNRNYYESPVNIRKAKLEAARAGYEALMTHFRQPAIQSGQKAAIVGGGPAGLAAAYFLAKGGIQTTIFEKNETPGGVVRHIIPDFRIAAEAIENDVKLIQAMGVRVINNCEIKSIEKLKKEFDTVVLAVGASEPSVLDLEQGDTMNALDFLTAFKQQSGKVNIGKNVVIIGGGNTAMDTARAAKRTAGVEKVAIAYRRTKRYMPADEDELELAEQEGIEFMDLLSPVSCGNGSLLCSVMSLGQIDASGRQSAVKTGDNACIDADTVICAVGEKVPEQFYRDNGLKLNSLGKLAVNKMTLETSIPGVYAVGDGLNGPSSVVEAIRDATIAAEHILNRRITRDLDDFTDPNLVYARKGLLNDEDPAKSDSNRCLGCSTVCENCVEVCPNRANISVQVPGMRMNQVIHIDGLCNECGNCRSFCPYDSAPYRDKLTLFAHVSDMETSENKGFAVIDRSTGLCQVRLDQSVVDYRRGEKSGQIPVEIAQVIDAVIDNYSYLLVSPA